MELEKETDEDETFLLLKENPEKPIKFNSKLNTYNSTKPNAR